MGKMIRRMLVYLAVASSTLGVVAAQGPVSAQALVEKLQAVGLEAVDPKEMVKADYGRAPVLCKGVSFGLPSYGEDVFGRAYYCARKADRERLARYYTDLGKRDPEQFTHVFVNAPFLLTIDGIVSDEEAEKYDEALQSKQVQMKAVETATVTAPPVFRVEIQKAGYEQWGRPKIMDNPNFRGPCNGDDNQAVLKLGISLAIYNTGAAAWPTGSRSLRFYKANGAPAASCLYDYMDDKGYPPTTTGNAWVASYNVFVERGERVGYGIFKVQNIGEIRFDVPQNLPVP